MGRRTLFAVALLGTIVLAGCSNGAGGTGAPADTSGASSSVTPAAAGGAGTGGSTGDPGSPAADGDPNAAGRASAAATVSPQTSGAQEPAMPGGSMAICANETLGESMTRAVDAGNSVVVATGGFTGTTATGDGEIGVPYSEVQLTVERTLGGPAVPQSLSAWVYGDLAAPGGAATTGEASSLWARGGRMVAVVDTASQWSGLPGPVIRVAPVVGDELILSWVGCWSTTGVTSREFEASVDIFDERGLHPAELQLFAVSLDEFAGLFAG